MSSRETRVILLALLFSGIVFLFSVQLPGLVSWVADAHSSRIGHLWSTPIARLSSNPDAKAPAAINQNNNNEFYVAAPTATTFCISNSISVTDPTWDRENTGVDCTNAQLFGNFGSHFDAYAFRITGCSGTFSITATTCTGAACSGTTGTGFTLMRLLIYQKPGGAPGTAGSPIFNPLAQTTNYRVGDGGGNGGSCTVGTGGRFTTLASNHPTCALVSGDFVLVVSGGSSVDVGSYNLLVTTTGCTSIAHTSPTTIALDALTSTSYESGTLVEWQTGFETDNLGFNVHREVNGKRTKLTEQLIAGSALLTGAGTTLTAGRAYSWWDDSQERKQNARYWLEEVSLDGQVKWHGPVVTNRSTDRNPPPGRGRASLLSSLTNSASSSRPLQQVAAPVAITPGQMRIQSKVASQPALKLSVQHEGWYRLSRQDLLSAGLDPATEPRNLQLFVDGNEQPILVHGEQDGRLDPNDGVEFFGLGLDTFSTDSHTYWLVAGSQAGLRLTQGKAKAKRELELGHKRTARRFFFHANQYYRGNNELFAHCLRSRRPNNLLW